MQRTGFSFGISRKKIKNPSAVLCRTLAAAPRLQVMAVQSLTRPPVTVAWSFWRFLLHRAMGAHGGFSVSLTSCFISGLQQANYRFLSPAIMKIIGISEVLQIIHDNFCTSMQTGDHTDKLSWISLSNARMVVKSSLNPLVVYATVNARHAEPGSETFYRLKTTTVVSTAASDQVRIRGFNSDSRSPSTPQILPKIFIMAQWVTFCFLPTSLLPGIYTVFQKKVSRF